MTKVHEYGLICDLCERKSGMAEAPEYKFDMWLEIRVGGEISRDMRRQITSDSVPKKSIELCPICVAVL